MASPSSAAAQAFERARNRFRQELSPAEDADFRCTTLENVHDVIDDLQKKQGSEGQLRNLKRVKGFVEAMEQYEKVINVFLNTTDLLAFIWGPIKFILLIASTWAESLDRILDTYELISENIPSFIVYGKLFVDNTSMQKVLERYYCDILQFHRQALRFFKRPAWKKLFSSSWKTFRTQFDPILNSLSRHKALVESQTGLYTFSEVQQTREIAEKTREVAEQIQVLAERQSQKLQAERRSQWLAVKDKLHPPDAHMDYQNIAAERGESQTGLWILQHKSVEAWLTSKSPPNALLWLNGIPGAGKSTLASLIIDEILKRQDALHGYFYCRQDSAGKNSFTGILRCLLSQLVLQDDVLLEHLYGESSALSEMTLGSPSVLKKLLTTCFKSSNLTYIVIDGLDECKQGEGRKAIAWLISIFEEIEKTNPGSLRILCSSQRDGVLDKSLSNASVVSLECQDHKQDIELYSQQWSSKIRQKFNLDVNLEKDIWTRVSTSADGKLLVPTTWALWGTDERYGQTRLRAELEPGVFPKGLEAAYDRVVCRIFDNENEAEREDAMQLLSWVVCARRPLKWRELQATFSIDPVSRTVDFEDRKLRVTCKDLCGSLVEVRSGNRPKSRDTVVLVHPTARAYLIQKKRICVAACEAEIANFCLCYLAFQCFHYALETREIEDYLRTGYYAFQDYATAHWIEHVLSTLTQGRLNSTTNPGALESSMISFIQQHAASLELRNNLEASNAVEVIETCSALARDRKPSATHLDIEPMMKRIRGVYENLMESSSLDDSSKVSLTALYGSDWFKCPKTWCDSFHEGFEERSLRESHVSQHERPFRCNITGCPAADLGYDTEIKLQKHHSRNHQEVNDEEWKFPSPPRKAGTDIFRAAANGDLELVKNFISDGVDMNQPSRPTGKQRPIFFAIKNGQYEVVNFLLDKGVAMNFIWGDNISPLSLACEAKLNPERLLHLLLDKLPDIEARVASEDGWLMRWAARQGKEATIARLLQCGADVDATHNESYETQDKTPLSWATENDHITTMMLLLENGAKVDAVFSNMLSTHQTPLLDAVRSGHVSAVKLLLERGADVNVQCSQGRTPLSWATWDGDEAIVKLLLESGADVNIKDSYSEAPLSRAAQDGHEAIVKLLLGKGADLDSRDLRRRTPLTLATLHGHQNIAAILEEEGAEM